MTENESWGRTPSLERQRELPHRGRVEPASVVARDHVEVVTRDPVARLDVRFLEQQQAERLRPDDAGPGHRRDAVGGPHRRETPLGESAIETTNDRIVLV